MRTHNDKKSAAPTISYEVDGVLTISVLENEMVKVINELSSQKNHSIEHIYTEHLKRLTLNIDKLRNAIVPRIVDTLEPNSRLKCITEVSKYPKPYNSKLLAAGYRKHLNRITVSSNKVHIGVEIEEGFPEEKVEIYKRFLDKSGVIAVFYIQDLKKSSFISVVNNDPISIISQHKRKTIKLRENRAMTISDINLENVAINNTLDLRGELIHEFTVLRRFLTGKKIETFVPDEQELINQFKALDKQDQETKLDTLKKEFSL